MERLTGKTRNFDGTGFAMESLVNDKGILTDFTDKVLTKLADYEDAEEQGLLLRLPCKVGSTVYNTTWWDDVEEKVKVDGKTFWRMTHKHKVSKSKFSYMDIKDFGKTVFLTREEAEKVLEDMKGGAV